MATFHPFPRLPAELRAQIWQMTVEPRIVEVRLRVRGKWGEKTFNKLTSPTPVPAPLQTCRESRNAGLYQRCFSDMPWRGGAAKDAEPRYVWLNLDIDMVSIGWSNFEAFRPVAHLIKRLRFTRDNTDEYWASGDEPDELYHYKNVSEIHVVLCEGSEFEEWQWAAQDYTWPCGKENVLFIDYEQGQEMKLTDLENKYDHF